MSEDLISIGQAVALSEELGQPITRQCIHQWIKAGRVTGRRHGYYWHVERSAFVAHVLLPMTAGTKPRRVLRAAP